MRLNLRLVITPTNNRKVPRPRPHILEDHALIFASHNCTMWCALHNCTVHPSSLERRSGAKWWWWDPKLEGLPPSCENFASQFSRNLFCKAPRIFREKRHHQLGLNELIKGRAPVPVPGPLAPTAIKYCHHNCCCENKLTKAWKLR